MAQRHPRRGAGGAGSGGAAETRPGSAGAVGKMNPTCGVHASARGEREGADDGRREAKKKMACAKYANDASGLSGLGQPVGFDLRERRGASRAGWAEGRVGREGLPGRK
jgi:hypothetical protein